MSSIKTWNEHKILRIWGGLSPPQYLALYAKEFCSNFNYFFYGLYDSGVILKDLGQNSSFSVKSDIGEGVNPLIYVIKIHEYRSSLRNLIRKVRMFITSKDVRKNKNKN